MYELQYDAAICAKCETFDCLTRCQYMDLGLEEARTERQRILDGEDSRVLRECATCYACEEYCPHDNHPFYLIVERQEQLKVWPVPLPLTDQQIRMMGPRGESAPRKVTAPVINMCAFRMLQGCIRGTLFEGASTISGSDIFCNVMWLHFAKNSVIRERLPRVIDNIMNFYLRESGVDELICFHDECYGTYTRIAPAFGIEVPFKPVHLFEYLVQRLTELRSQIRPIGEKVVYQRPCSNRLIPETQHWVDEIFELIGVDRVDLVAYQNVGSNNADLPADAFLWDKEDPPNAVEDLWRSGRELPFDAVFHSARLILAPTEFSTTAPLKLASAQHGFRAATMPGFTSEMIPALRLDYEEVNRRVALLKEKLDGAVRASITFLVDGRKEYILEVDLRHRQAHASGGCFLEEGQAGNLPSGETYIVPYEGEAGEPSATEGILPVQHGDDVVLYEIRANKAKSVSGEGEAARQEAELLNREPAYGNIAELGFGVLGDFGLEPIGQILLDEKLGFHIAFGRSDHFGGAVGPADFSSPQAVVHIDRIYIPSTQPRVKVEEVKIALRGGESEVLLKDGLYSCI